VARALNDRWRKAVVRLNPEFNSSADCEMLAPLAALPQNRHPGVGVGKLGPEKIVDRNRQSEFQSWSRQVWTASFAMSI
jgi:hypothetical protein